MQGIIKMGGSEMIEARGSRVVVGACALAFLLIGSMNGAQAVPEKTPEQIKQVCDKAEQRYQKIFGKSSASEKVVIVLMYNYTFCPAKITIKRGESVRWVNVDKRTSHSTWFKQADKEEGERLFSLEKSEMKFDLPPGEYPYLCGPHWESDGMIGKVTVAPW
jgi:plastocyanin